MKDIAIVGAGCSGLAAIKCCLDEGLNPTCFEKDTEIGGLWNYSHNVRLGKGSVYRSCVMNTSKDMMAFSDFPVPTDFPTFMPHSKVNQYFGLYADHFDLKRHIKFETSVEKIIPASNYDSTGRWDVTYSNLKDGATVTETYDGVLVCSGHHTHPNIPDIESIGQFLGTVKHSHAYRDNEDLAGKIVVVLGIGNSAVDIATDASHKAEQVYLSTRRGAWVIGRKGIMGLPADAMANSRFMFSLPKSILQSAVEKMSLFNFDHKSYGILPEHRAFESHPTITDELPLRIMTGSIKLKPKIQKFSEEEIHFADGTSTKADVVIFATGYDYKIPFLAASVTQLKDNEPFLYKNMFPPQLKHPTLAVIGLVQAVGAIMPISEIQCRWFTSIMTGRCQLPSCSRMSSEIEKERQQRAKQYYESKRHTIQAFWIEYMDDIAAEIGVKPNFWKLWKSKPRLAMKCLFGPCFPAQYRLHGHGKWHGAAAYIEGTMKSNMIMKKRRQSRAYSQGVALLSPLPDKRDSWSRPYMVLLVFVAIALLVFFW